MGAVSGLGDMSANDDAQVAALLLEALPRLNEENLGMALGAMVRTPARSMALLDAIVAGKVDRKKLAETARKALLTSADKAVRAKAESLFK